MHTHAGPKVAVQKSLITGRESTTFYALGLAYTKRKTKKAIAFSLVTLTSVTYLHNTNDGNLELHSGNTLQRINAHVIGVIFFSSLCFV